MRRSVYIEGAGKDAVAAELVIATPVKAPSGDYVCKWKLLPYFPEQGIYGIDPLSSLLTALAFIRALVEEERKKGVCIYFLRKGDCCGIPRVLALKNQ